MTRFEPQTAGDARLTETVGAATEQLRAALEREALDIITKAQQEAEAILDSANREAASIADAARERAEETEREAHERAEQVRASHAGRIEHALAGVDTLEERLQATLDDLRRRLSGELDQIRPRQPEPPPEPELPPEPVQVADEEPDVPAPEPAPAFSGPVPLSVATQVDSATERNPVLDDMMRTQIQNMAESGAPRGEAEQFLARFKLGESYLGMLDDVYSQRDEHGAAPQGRRRRFRRRDT